MRIQRRRRHIFCSVGSPKGAEWVIPHFLSATSNGGWLEQDSSSFSSYGKNRDRFMSFASEDKHPESEGRAERRLSREIFHWREQR